MRKIGFILTFLLFAQHLLAQNTATLRGIVTDSLGKPLPFATIGVLGTDKGVTTDTKGVYVIVVPAGKNIVVLFKHIAYKEIKQTFSLKPNETVSYNIQLKENAAELATVEVTNKDEQRIEISTITLKPTKLKEIPTPFGDALDIIKVIGLGVVTTTELSSAYSVRGGSFEENLLYVNNMEIYRPFLVSGGQQEGLSFPNPDLIKDIKFSAGGWQAKYGDKLSSCLNIEYKTPTKFAASASLGLLGGTGHIEGSTKNRRLTYLLGVRHKSAAYLFNTFETTGSYQPRFTDVQGLVSYALSREKSPINSQEARTSIEMLVSYAQNRYQVIPQTRRTEFGTFNQALALTVAFEGQEMMNYDTWQGNLRLKHHFSKQFSTQLITSAVSTQEREYANVEAGYQLCDINTQVGKDNRQERCATIRGIGTLYDYRRNALDATIFAIENRNEWRQADNHTMEAGIKYSHESIKDNVYEYNFVDSADYVTISNLLEAANTLNSSRLMAYIQQNHSFNRHIFTYGLRANYWDLNGQFLLSPRLQYAYKPNWQKDILFNLAVGYYQQPPFYRELRNYQGQLNLNLKAQTSVHLIGGMNWDFKYWGRPFRLITEAYYKYLTNVVPYDVDNVRLRYYAQNNAVAFTTGIDARLSGEFIKGTDSWIGVSVMNAQEKVEGDERGFIRRPVDQRFTLTMNFEDHLPKQPTWRMNFRMMYGSGLPFGVPNEPTQRAVLSGNNYWRVDIGFSKIIYLQNRKDRSLWLGLEVLNLLGNNNTISYLWIKDYGNRSYAIPNGLSQRFINLRAIFRWN